LAGLGARASGVGMLTLAVPESLRWMVVAQLPEALVIGCPETETGSLADLPTDIAQALDRYDAIACGPGLSRQAGSVVEAVLACDCPLVLDADALNHVAQRHPSATLAQRSAPTVITPHLGEFRRLFPEVPLPPLDPGQAAQTAAAQSQTIVVLKGACTAIAHPDGQLWFNADSTPGLARGGSGDVLTGLMAGLLAQTFAPLQGSRSEADRGWGKDALALALDAALAGVWWHSQAAKEVVAHHTELGVDGPRLAAALTTTLAATLAATLADHRSPTPVL
ncbi:MAG: NAD(P)H-hydrate dehydratase, partial [Leptolyngbya sp.]|nr:NAD(P)H-hydrate dehydratase [Leptolyngbya sp.]